LHLSGQHHARHIHEALAHGQKSGTSFTLQALPSEIRDLFEELAMESVLRAIADPPQTGSPDMIR